MGQAASGELKTAQSTLATLTRDLAASRSALAASEAAVHQAKSEAVVRGARSVGSAQLVDGVIARAQLERELEGAKRAARVRAGELERAQQELKTARDAIVKTAGDAKLKARFPDRAAIEAWTAAQSKKTQDQALWKRTRAARRPKYTSNAVADAPAAAAPPNRAPRSIGVPGGAPASRTTVKACASGPRPATLLAFQA